MSGGTKKAINGNAASSASFNGGGFGSKLEYYLYSGDKKHVAAGIAIIGVVIGVPWYLMNRGTKHISHQDYMEKADRARNERLSAGSTRVKG